MNLSDISAEQMRNILAADYSTIKNMELKTAYTLDKIDFLSRQLRCFQVFIYSFCIFSLRELVIIKESDYILRYPAGLFVCCDYFPPFLVVRVIMRDGSCISRP